MEQVIYSVCQNGKKMPGRWREITALGANQFQLVSIIPQHQDGEVHCSSKHNRLPSEMPEKLNFKLSF